MPQSGEMKMGDNSKSAVRISWSFAKKSCESERITARMSSESFAASHMNEFVLNRFILQHIADVFLDTVFPPYNNAHMKAHKIGESDVNVKMSDMPAKRYRHYIVRLKQKFTNCFT